MGYTKEILKPGDGKRVPKSGDTIIIHYTGYLYDESKADDHFKGKKFDTSKERGPLKSQIGIGGLIKGWDEAVPKMSVGEKAVLTVTSDYGYGKRGFPELIPPDSTLVFDVELVDIL